MVVFNGEIFKDNARLITTNNVALSSGHAVIETLRISNGILLLWEAHYLKIMATMRMLRIRIPMSFTPEYLSNLILKAFKQSLEFNGSALVIFQVYPTAKDPFKTAYHIWFKALGNENIERVNNSSFEMGLYKDFYISKTLLSTLATPQKIVFGLAEIFAHENGLNGCFLLNTDKEVVGSSKGILFMVTGQVVQTSPILSGVQDSVYRKALLTQIRKDKTYTLLEAPISPFSLQKATTLLILNPSDGIINITKYRKKEYEQPTVALQFASSLHAATKAVID